MEGSLPVIGPMLEAPAALTKTAEPASASNPFAALLAQLPDDPAGVPGGSGLPASGLPLPPVPAVVKPVSVPVAIDLPVNQTSLTADVPIPEAAATRGPPAADPLISELLKAPANALDTENIDTAETTVVATTEADGDTPALPQAAPDLSTAIPGDQADGGAPLQAPPGVVVTPPPVEIARQFVAESALTATDPADDPVVLRSQARPATTIDQAMLRDPPAATTATATPTTATIPMSASAATMAARMDLAGPALSAAAAAAVPVQQAALQTESAGSEVLDMSDLPFDSIRVSVRDPAGDRPMPNREPAFHLPGPRQALGDPQWSRALGERLAVVVRGEHQVARMSLNPAHLGPIDIHLRLQDDQAQLWLTAQHPQARDALEAAIPRLREMFAQQGIDLSQQGASGQQREQSADAGPERPADAARPALDHDEPETPAVLRPGGGGLLDHYA